MSKKQDYKYHAPFPNLMIRSRRIDMEGYVHDPETCEWCAEHSNE